MASESTSQCRQKVRKSGGAQKNKRKFQGKGFASNTTKILGGTGTPDSLSSACPASSKRNRRPGTTSKVFEGKCPPGPSGFTGPATSSNSVKSSTSLFDKSDFKTLVRTMQALHKRKHPESERHKSSPSLPKKLPLENKQVINHKPVSTKEQAEDSKIESVPKSHLTQDQ